jgi:transcriptional regulator with PAS, ATPase and Fis domain
VLQESELERLGDTRTRKVDVRLVAATNENLEEAVKQGRFRSDLLYRLNVYSVLVPPLRARIDDVPDLVKHFLDKYCSLHGKQVQGITDRAMTMLRTYQWPGNIRELGNMIERGVILARQGGIIEAFQLFPHLDDQETVATDIPAAGAPELDDFDQGAALSLEALADQLLGEGCELARLETVLIERAMERAGGNVSRAAKLLGLSRATLDYRLKKLRLAQ